MLSGGLRMHPPPEPQCEMGYAAPQRDPLLACLQPGHQSELSCRGLSFLMPRPQLRGRRVRSRQYNYGRADSHAAVEVFDIFVGQTNTARGHEGAYGGGLIGAVDTVFRVTEIHRACPKRIGFTPGHEARQVGLALNHLLRRQPVRPFFHAADVLGARPSEALTTYTNPVANCLAMAERQVKVGVRRIDDDGSGRLNCKVIDYGPIKPR